MILIQRHLDLGLRPGPGQGPETGPGPGPGSGTWDLGQDRVKDQGLVQNPAQGQEPDIFESKSWNLV